MRIALGADHAGVGLKDQIKGHLQGLGFSVTDFGTDSTQTVDYPDFAARVGQAVSNGLADRGVLFCGSGVGMAMAANKVQGVRAATVLEAEAARLSRAHNDANVLSLGARVTPVDIATRLVDIFLSTPFDGGRHQRRVDKISALEREPEPVS